MLVHMFKVRFLEASSRNACKNSMEFYFLEAAILQVETDRWGRNITDQDIILLQITFTDPVLAQG